MKREKKAFQSAAVSQKNMTAVVCARKIEQIPAHIER